jgi:transcriptional regulator with XRE-family HTH domain
MTTLKNLKRKLLANPDVRAEYEALKLEEQLAAELTRVRVSAGLTQAQLAKRMKAKQAAIARVESGRHLPSLATLRDYAAATGQYLEVSFKSIRPQRRRRSNTPPAVERKRQPGSLVTFFTESPLRGSGLKIKRVRD